MRRQRRAHEDGTHRHRPRIAPLPRGWGVWVTIGSAVMLRVALADTPHNTRYWREQMVEAGIAANFAERSPNILWPESDFSCDRPAYLECGLQIVPWLTSLVYRAFGIQDWGSRLVTIPISVVSMWLLYTIVVRSLGAEVGLAALVFYAFAPSAMYGAVSLSSESLATCCSVAFVLSFSGWVTSPSRSRYVSACASGALAILVSMHSLYIVGLLGYIAWHHKATLKAHALAAAGLVAALALPALAYYLHAHFGIGLQYLASPHGDVCGVAPPAMGFMNLASYSKLIQTLVAEDLTPIGIALLVLGCATRSHGPARMQAALFQAWIVAAALAMVAEAVGGDGGECLRTSILPPAAALVGIGYRAVAGSQRFSKHVGLALLACFLTMSYGGLQLMLSTCKPLEHAKAVLDELDPTKAPVIVFPPGTTCLSYLARQGWVGREDLAKLPSSVLEQDVPGPAYIEARALQGARWVLVVMDVSPGLQPGLMAHLYSAYDCVGGSRYVRVFDLLRKRGADAPPAPPDWDAVEPKLLHMAAPEGEVYRSMYEYRMKALGISPNKQPTSRPHSGRN
jgi:hypothetical protein